MRAVNLLPPSDRAKSAPVAPNGASKILLGVLAVLVLAMLSVVVTQNQITSKRDQIQKLTSEMQVAQQRAAKLGSYGEFSQIKATRVQSISDLAKKRFDWERLMREMALVLPKGTWISSLDAAAAGSPEASSTSGPASQDTSGTPSAKISGCAPSQSTVAETMVRLRGLYRAEDVNLTNSDAPDSDAGGGAAASAATSDSGTASAAGCGKNYSFTATVSFGEAGREAPRAEKRVPGRLGGGA